ncbi:MAG: heme o synthase [Acidimicrobiia bacterium]|nr:MAG: heme o synthase [Acidimicrobiia bacterium]
MSGRSSTDARKRSTLATYIELTKPRIVELLLITTIPAMAVAAGGWPDTLLVIAAVIGGSLSAGGANAINQVYDSDIDSVMARTKGRPLPTGRVSATAATIFGISLGIAGFVVLWLGTTLLAGILSLVAFAFYVFIYTMLLKRSSTQNIVIGGAAGAVPALIGWAAVTGDLSVASWSMFAVIFFWTPPHFWALSLKYEDDYRAAGVPMLPVVAGARSTYDQILWYSIVTVGITFLVVPVAGLSWIYAGTAVVFAVPMVVLPLRLRTGKMHPMQFFGYTNLYLAAVFLSMMVDRFVFDTGFGGAWSWALVGTGFVVLSLIGVAMVEARPQARAEGVSPARHIIEVGVTMAFAVALLVATWGAIAA